MYLEEFLPLIGFPRRIPFQALQIMNFLESGDQDNDHEGNSEEVVIKIMITRKFLESGDQDNDHHIFMNHDHFMIILAQATPWTLYAIYTVSRLYIWRLKYFVLEVSI